MSHDFVDYFFQKDGDTYIAALIKTKQENDEKCDKLYANADDELRNRYKILKTSILDVSKITITQERFQNFDFVAALASAFEGLDVEITESLNAIQKYYEFIQNMNNHWIGLQVDAATVVEVGIQMMATIESMVYPLFLKMIEYITSLTANGAGKSTPEEMMARLHKLVDALMVEIAAIGTSCVLTIGKSITSEDQLKCDSTRLGCQGRYAKNCIAWAMKAVSSVILYYFMLTNPSKGRPAETPKFGGGGSGGGCNCNAGGCSPNFAVLEAEERRIRDLAEEGERRIRQRAEEAENRIIKRTEEGDRRLKDRTVEAEERIRNTTPCGEGRAESRQREPEREKRRSKEPEPEPEKLRSKEPEPEPEKRRSKEPEPEKRRSKEPEPEKPKVEEPQEEPKPGKSKKKKRKKEGDDEERKKRREERKKRAQEKRDKANRKDEGGTTSASEGEKTDEGANKKLHEDDQEHWNAQSHGQGNDFVDYFFQKDGLKYIADLSEIKRKYEARCKELLSKIGAKGKQASRSFIEKVHDARKVTSIGEPVEVKNYNFAEKFTKDIEQLSIDATDKLAMIHKYNEYVTGMFKHWEYRIEKDTSNQLGLQTVIDGGTQMMATTMSLVYPVFIRIGEFLINLNHSAPESKSKYPPESLVNLLHKLVLATAIDMAAIGMSCITTISKIPDVTKTELKLASNAISIQAKFGKNAIAWAMKAISPLLLLYFMKCETGNADNEKSESEGGGKSRSKSKKKKRKDKKKKDNPEEKTEVREEPTEKKRNSKEGNEASGEKKRNSKEEAPVVKEEAPVAKEEPPVEKKRNSKEEAPVAKEEAPVEKKRNSKEEAPVEKKRNSKEEAPVERKRNSKEEAPVAKDEPPVEKKRNSKDNDDNSKPKEIKEDASSEKPKKKKKKKKKNKNKTKQTDDETDPSKAPTGQVHEHSAGHDIYHPPKKAHDFVDYFFQKNGEVYLATLTDVRKKYEDLCNSTLPSATPAVKKKTRGFLVKVHDARKVTPAKTEVELTEFNFIENINSIFGGIESNMKDTETMIKYFEFTKNMVIHWKYRVTNNMELDPDAVVEVGVQMMATTVALAYPCFIKMSELLEVLAKDPKLGKLKAPPEKIVERLHRFVELLTTNMSSIGTSCANTVATMPVMKKEGVQPRRDRLANQTKYANNSIAWAMKSLGPLLLYYFIKFESAS